MKSKITMEERLLEVAKLTNEAKKLDEESKNKIRMYHQMLLEKFVDKKHPLRKEIEKMLGQVELMEALFPKQVADLKNEKIQMKNEIVKNMKDHGDDLEYISKITNIPIEEIKQI